MRLSLSATDSPHSSFFAPNTIRYVRLPAIFQVSSRVFVDRFRADPSSFPRRASWELYASFFGLTPAMAETAVMDHSACKIQARQRGAFQRKQRLNSIPESPSADNA
jgi:hypothetical protein